MNEVIIPAILSGTASTFAECAINALIGFFTKKNSSNKLETSQTEIHRYVDKYLKEHYPNLTDYRYINDKLFEFIVEYIKYLQPAINVNGNVTINFIFTNNGIENSITNFLELPENKKWSEIELLTHNESNPISNLNISEKTVPSLILRAKKVGLQLDISNNCNSEKIDELLHIVEKYESLHKKGGKV